MTRCDEQGGKVRFVSSLRVRLFLLVCLAVLPAFGLALYTDLEQRRLAAVEVQDNAVRLTRLTASNLAQFVEGARQLLVAQSVEQSRARASDWECGAYLADLLEQYPLYASLGVIGAEGDLVCSSHPFTRPVNLAGHAWLQRVVQTRSFVVGEYQADRVAGETALNFGYPVLDAAGQVRVIVFAALDPAVIDRLAARAKLPKGAVLMVLDRGGALVARYPEPEQWVGKSMPEAAIVQAILSQGEGAALVPGVDGIPRLYAFAPVEGTAESLYVSIGIPQATAFDAIDRALARNLVILGLVSALVIAAAWFSGKAFILRPLNALVNATRRLTQGDLSARANVSYTSGEVGQLARAFDEMAESLQRRTAQLEAANKELEAFNYTVSHDLRAPLQFICGYGELLQQDYAGQLDATGRESLQRMCATSQRMAQLVDDLLNLSRGTHHPIQREAVDLSALAWAIAADLRRAAPGRQVEFFIAQDVVAHGDKQLLRVVLENLMGNAWKYTGKQPRPRIEFGALRRPDGEQVYLVRDNGAGFDMAQADRLFVPFQRLHSKSEFSGTGIGLATVQRIVHRHDGHIWAESVVGGGATFYFTLPSPIQSSLAQDRATAAPDESPHP